MRYHDIEMGLVSCRLQVASVSLQAGPTEAEGDFSPLALAHRP
jgi:hypothetical protein